MQNLKCAVCNFSTLTKCNYEQHLKTKKHIKNAISQQKTHIPILQSTNIENLDKAMDKKICNYCNKLYSCRQTLSIHIKKCKEKNKQLPVANLTIDSVKQLLQNKEIMTEIIKSVAISNDSYVNLANNGTINNGNINNGTVNNLNLFFDTKCKDAMNLSEFFEALQVTNSDVENMGKNGFSTGIYEIIDKGLKECGLYKRPIHCTDTKRETLYIKENDKWQKDDPDNPTVKKYIKDIRIKSIDQSKKWKESHPNSEIIGSNEYEFWFYIMNNINNGGVNEIRNYNKIVSCISRTTDISAMRRDRALM